MVEKAKSEKSDCLEMIRSATFYKQKYIYKYRVLFYLFDRFISIIRIDPARTEGHNLCVYNYEVAYSDAFFYLEL